MDARIVEFAEVLRQNGVRVSPSEVQDAVIAAEALGFADRGLFRAALEATMVKRELDVEVFRRSFDFYFSGAAKTFEAIDRSLGQRIEEEGLVEGDDLKMILYTLQELLAGMTPLAQAALLGDRGQLANLFRQATLQLDLARMETPLQAGFFSRRLLTGAGAEKARSELDALAKELERRGVSPKGVEVVSRHVAQAMRKVEEAARKEIQGQAKARLKSSGDALRDKTFQTLSRAEIEQAQTAVRRLAERLKSRLIRKQRSHRKGALHVRRTLRKNMPWGGVPMVPQFRHRRPERPEVIILCDVSDSVRNTSRLMLLFMHTLQSLFVRVRSFVFVSDIGEVTRHFRELDVDEAIDLATAGKAVSLHSNSNYGRALATFARDHLGGVTRRTTVMVIGDGRNNYNSANTWALEDVRQKAKRLLWICPEDKRGWGFGDSEMNAYAAHCHQAVVVQSLGDLEHLADALVPV